MNLIEISNQDSISSQFDKLPSRIFLDTNIIQYLADFGSFVFDGEQEDGILVSPKGKAIREGSHLYSQIVGLKMLFQMVGRTPFHFATSESIYQEISRKHDSKLMMWFLDIWNHWQTVRRVSGDCAFQGYGHRKVARFQSDKSIINGLSKLDFKVLSDALLLESDALLTCDKFRNRHSWIFAKYNMMVLYPSDLIQMSKGFHALWY
jgi:hypothetical protein